MPFTQIPATRETLLETAFCDIPQCIADLTLRPLSAGSFTLLGRLANPMIVGAARTLDQTAMFEAVIQYVWIHSAPLDEVLAVESTSDLPADALKRLAFVISIDQALHFLSTYGKNAIRMTASLAEADDEEDAPGKHQVAEPVPVGSPHLSLHSAQPVTVEEKNISFGSCPSSEPSVTSMPPTLQTEPAAPGPARSVNLPTT